MEFTREDNIEARRRVEAYLAANKLTIFADLGFNDYFGWREIKFNQDESGMPKRDEDGRLIEGEFEEPTFNWTFNILTQRKSDEEFFQVRVIEYNKEILNPSIEAAMKLLDEDFKNGIETLLEFKDCSCRAESACEIHDYPSKYSKEEELLIREEAKKMEKKLDEIVETVEIARAAYNVGDSIN